VGEFGKIISDSTVQLVDVRTAEEFAAGNIAGSVNIDVNGDDFAGEALKRLDRKRTVAVYCRSGRRSRTAAELLIKKGFQKVYNLDKGILNWMEEGREINKPTE
jgi:rhodanese-related sulfurtransferase